MTRVWNHLSGKVFMLLESVRMSVCQHLARTVCVRF